MASAFGNELRHLGGDAGLSLRQFAARPLRGGLPLQDRERAAEQVQPDDLDELGGMCRFGPIRMHYYAADAMAWLPERAADAERHAESACAAYADTESPEWAFGDQAGAHAALSIARIARGEIDGAADALAPVLQLAPDQRINGIVSSTRRVSQALRQASATTVTEELIEEIELFARTPAAALPR